MLPEHGGSVAELSESAQRFVVSDELWALIEPHLPQHPNTHRFGGGRPRKSDRVCMDAIFFVLRTGCQWNALDATGICPSSTAHDRFQEWVQAGVFLELWKAGLLEYDDLKGIDWAWLSMDGAMTKSPLSGEKMWSQSHGSRQRRSQTLALDRGRWRAGRTGRRGRQPA
jgi:transposase